MGFERKVLDLVSEIPEGKVSTYGRVAEALGKPNASRAVGNALAKNPNPGKIPCHRVIRSDGTIGGYTGGRDKKRQLLQEEGVNVEGNRVNLEKYLYEEFGED